MVLTRLLIFVTCQHCHQSNAVTKSKMLQKKKNTVLVLFIIFLITNLYFMNITAYYRYNTIFIIITVLNLNYYYLAGTVEPWLEPRHYK
jgi:hypothetical protein